MIIRNILNVSIFATLLVAWPFNIRTIDKNIGVVLSKVDSGIIITGVESNAVGVQLEISLEQGTFKEDSYYRDDAKTSFMKINNDTQATIYVASDRDLRLGDDIFVGLLNMSDDMVISNDAKLTVVDFILGRDTYENVGVSVVDNPLVDENVTDTTTPSTKPSTTPSVPEEEKEDGVKIPLIGNWLSNLQTYLNNTDTPAEFSIHLISLALAFICFVATLVKVFKEK